MDLTDISRTFHSYPKEYTFSLVHGILSKIDHKASLSRTRKTETASCILSERNGTGYWGQQKLHKTQTHANKHHPAEWWSSQGRNQERG